MKISVFGTGYVGLVTGVCFAEMGNEVICVDVDAKKIQMLKDAQSPIYEPGLEELLRQNLKSSRLHFTTDAVGAIQKADLIFIAVGTPPHEDGKADLKYVLQVAQTIGEHINSEKIVITKSTVPVGTNEKVKKTISDALIKRGASFDFQICSNPEFLREGSAIEDCLRPDRVVVGIESENIRQTLERLYEPFLENSSQLLLMDIPSAEMTKYAANAMLATKISFMNEIARLCEKSGANIDQIKKGIGSDHRIGPHFIQAGIGYGGSCFPKDVQALIRTGNELGENLAILKAVEEVNFGQRKSFSELIQKRFQNQLKGRTFCLWGVAFKPGTDDIREAPSLSVITDLLSAGAKVTVFDPAAAENTQSYFSNHSLVGEKLATLAAANLKFVNDQYLALQGSDALILVTEWKSFREPDFNRIKSSLKSPVLFDGRNIYSPAWMKEQGFEYFSVGRP